MSSNRELVLITGAGAGLGLEVARRHVRRGYHVLAVERSAELARAAADVIGRHSTPVACDLADPADVAELCARIDGEWAEDLDIYVLNVGADVPGDVAASPAQVIDLHLDVLLRSTMQIARAAAATLVARTRGHIVATVSPATVPTPPGSAVRSAAAAGLRAYLGALHRELDGTGITVGGVYPRAGDAAPGAADREPNVEDVADGVDRVVKRGSAEEVVPHGDGYPTRLLRSLPGLTRRLRPAPERRLVTRIA